MSLERNIRINKVLRELNISLERAIDILKSGGFEIEANPNSKINEFEFNFLKYRLNIPVNVEKPTITNSTTLSRLRNKLGIPQTVFKYFGTEDYHFESLMKSYLFYSNYENFNDPFDCNSNLISFEKEKKRTKFKRKEEKLKDNFTKLGVCCFSRKVDSILMWSHYASNHKGFCVEFHCNIDLKGINPLDVNYVSTFLKADYYKAEKDAIFHMIFTKAKQWSYEEELRSIQNNLLDNNARKIPFRKGDIKAIYLGVNCEESTRDKITEIVNVIYESKIIVFQGKLSESTFEIVWEKII